MMGLPAPIAFVRTSGENCPAAATEESREPGGETDHEPFSDVEGSEENLLH